MNGKTTIGSASPVIMNAKVVGELTHKVNFETVTKCFLKPSLGSIVSSPVTAIINI
jgi:hypothetical protein